MQGESRGRAGLNEAPSERRRASPHPKGRVISDDARADVQRVLGPVTTRRDLLIEHLHRLQDHFGCLRVEHLAALAELMRLAQTEVFEVATFYAHFDVIGENDPPPPGLTVRVCDGVACALAGGEALRERLRERLGADVRTLRAPCVGRCDSAPVAVVGRRSVDLATVERVEALVRARKTEPLVPAYEGLQAYRDQGGYRVLADCRAGRLAPETAIARIEASGLRGLGGAGFPTAQKWRFVRDQPGPRLMAVNADEGEPGTFKDRHYLETRPHRFLEGTLIAAWAVEAEQIFIYLRDEYHHVRELLQRELALLERAGTVAADQIVLRRGAGAYICGEETAMLESLEGKRGYPRHKPPFPTQVGLFGRPTLIHNVETLYWITDVLEHGPEFLAGHGRHGRKGLRSFSVSGRVKSPGVKLAPAGTTVRELIDEFCGGMLDGHQFRAYLPGGASGGVLPASLGDVPLDFGTLEPHGCFIGSAAVVVLSDQDDVRAVALNLMRFFEHESCGQCTPCRVGTAKAATLMERPVWDDALLVELSAAMRDASICGLGQAAPNPLLCVLKHFPEGR